MNKVPNLDCMTTDPLALRQWALDVIHSTSRTKAGLIGDKREGYVEIAKELARYALYKARAMEHRLAGKVRAALGCEAICERIYKELPEDLRW